MTCHDDFADTLKHNRITRRQVLWLLGAAGASAPRHRWAVNPSSSG